MSKHKTSTDATLETIDAGLLSHVNGGKKSVGKKKEEPGQGGLFGMDKETGRKVGKALGGAAGGAIAGPVGRAVLGAAGGHLLSGDNGRELARDYQRNLANGAIPYTG